MPDLSFRSTVEEKKLALATLIREPLSAMADECADIWPNVAKIDKILTAGIASIPQCKLIYSWDREHRILSSMVSPTGLDEGWQGKDVSQRPYLKKNLPFKGIMLSSVYSSEYDRRRTITALQAINNNNHLQGFIAVDFNVKDLLHDTSLHVANAPYEQHRGDPAVRGTLFQQHRIKSEFDAHADEILARLLLLMTDYGVFHAKVLFSSSRCTLWFYDDPFQYQLHHVNEIVEDDMLLAYPERQYPARAKTSVAQAKAVFDLFKKLRYIDDTVYLRSGSINIINNTVGLTFSCDGSHYMQVEAFLDKDEKFWIGY